MSQLKITKELYLFIQNECNEFVKKTWDANCVDVNDVLYSFLFSNENEFHILNDWDEGKNNDPFWNEEKNEHSAIVFLKELCEKIKLYNTKNG